MLHTLRQAKQVVYAAHGTESLICLFKTGVPQRWNLSRRLVGDSFNLHFNWLADQRLFRRIL
jgi:hypothetical protein